MVFGNIYSSMCLVVESFLLNHINFNKNLFKSFRSQLNEMHISTISSLKTDHPFSNISTRLLLLLRDRGAVVSPREVNDKTPG